MSETDTTQTPPDDNPAYRQELLERAATLGLTVHPAAKNETIAAKIAAALKDLPDPETGKLETPVAPATKVSVEPVAAGKEIHPAKRLHRVIITCNDPQKADQSGDIITVSNAEVGHIRFYFHFGKPWHVPEIVLETIKESKLFLHSSRKDGKELVTREVPRYNVQYLEPLTDAQRNRIADKQAAALATED